MGTVLKIGEDYYIEFTARGLRYRRNGGKRKEEALRLLKAIEEKIQNGEMSIVVTEIPITRFFTELLKKIRNEYSPKTSSRYQSVADHFVDYCQASLTQDANLSGVTPGVIEGYRAHLLKNTKISGRPIKPKVVNFTLVLLKDLLDHAINEGYLNDNPALHARLLNVPMRKIPRTLSDEEVKTVVRHCADDFKDMISVLLKSGMRAGEMTGLTWTSIDFEENCFTIDRHVPIDGQLLISLKRIHETKKDGQELVFDGALSTEQFTYEIGRVAEKIGLTASVFLSAVRNTFARDVLSRGVTLVGLYRLLGLDDIAKVMRYAGFIEKINH